ncbi:MAG: endonuclease III [Puniceicoccales bacterium]|jgi:endonuclease-3|nr:endonuclease III [Puniceicoccales bacterium]
MHFLKKQYILDVLNRLYPNPQASLFFADHPFKLLIATLLSARCKDTQVNKVTPILFQKAPTPQAMLRLSITTIQSIIRPCGLSHTKSNNIWQLSHILCEQFHSQVPNNFKDLESLPGIGHKTASVVLGYAFHQPTFPVDTHIHRLALRWGLSNKHSVKQIEQDLKTFFPQNTWFRLHLQMIYYGREYCNRHQCTHIYPCPICQKLMENQKC